MEAWIERAGEVVVVHLKGRVDYDTVEPFRHHCTRNLVNDPVVFNLRELSFVGSIGITDFVQAVTQLAAKTLKGIKFAAVGNEFRRVLEASEIENLAIYDSPDKAILAFQGVEVATLPRLSPVPETGFDDPSEASEGF